MKKSTQWWYGIGGLVLGAAVMFVAVCATNDRDMNSAMDGMMGNLEGKSGEAFDRAFLEDMIVHHEGAVDMAQMALTNGSHQEIKTMSEAIISAQTSEIEQMKIWLKEWYGTTTSEHTNH